MKKIIKNVLILLIAVIGINRVNALDNKYGIYCGYGDYYFMYTGSSLDDVFNIDTNFDQLGVLIEAGRPGKSLSNQEEKDWLIQKKILLSDGYLSCPIDAFGTTVGAPTAKECGEEDCNIEGVSTGYESYSCTYKGQSSSKSLSFNYTFNEEGPKWVISYPDGSVKSLTGTEINGSFMPSSDCGDIYYVASTKKISIAVPTNEGVTNATLKSLCRNYEENEIELFCSGDCTFEKNIVCPSYNTVYCGNLGNIPAALPQFIKNIVNIIKIVVPIFLVIMGMLDFAKAMVSSDEKAMKESQNKFIKRVVAAIIVFLVVAIVQLIFRIINTDDTNYMASCIDCFINGDCNESFDEGESYLSNKCYQCNSPLSVYKWDYSGTADSSCPSGYHERNDLTENTCHN